MRQLRNQRSQQDQGFSFQSNPLPSNNKFDKNQEESKCEQYCMSQRDIEGFNTDLNIFTAKYKVYENVDFSSPSFYKKKHILSDVQEKENEFLNQISDQKSQHSYGNNLDEYNIVKSSYSLNSHNSQKQQNQVYESERKPIFGPFTITQKEIFSNHNSKSKNQEQKSLYESIEYTRRNPFSFEKNQIQDNQISEIKNVPKKREMSVEQEYGQVVNKTKYNQTNKQQLNNNDFDFSDHKDKSHKNVFDDNQEYFGFKNMNQENKIYETPNNFEQKRKGKYRARIIDSSSAKQQNFNQNSNQSCTFKNLNKQIDLNNIIQNPSSKRRLTRSTNILHESFQKQIFQRQESLNQNKRMRNSNNKNEMKDERNQTCINKTKQEESKKLKKLVKNKRKSEGKNESLTQKQNLMSQQLKNCAICLGIPEDSIYGVVQCQHEFCIDCILQWSEVTNLCPMCRAEFSKIQKKNYNDLDYQEVITVEPKKQRINDDDEFYWEEVDSFLDDDGLDEVCYICETNQDENKLIICDHCGFRICHTYCDDELLDDQVPLEDWFCHECRQRSELFD
ncbi:C3HC4 type (RING finger) zinc finger protein (macronuclear) [Tetrahymena thermophila SB210]|uniref:C3HC4 type (RING finger) zinc finger protein n=1 Tax=Tetrahymena thermophila (strain SB210) TaxID=312017 RepID=Q234B3_TETTS|nr:C3HC4 type (RING finger) zinc finger protein [Tetrahymena thermophila SB210]EAR92090.2 C3HC4 type (RING finger) zinc finger protein [Tetrahymena thermophila SB210]|eukprot:XP_001012335.2 C3HC4 type (RING finger) zinc finger protein [Tetrahymena thermophila SB210]